MVFTTQGMEVRQLPMHVSAKPNKTPTSCRKRKRRSDDDSSDLITFLKASDEAASERQDKILQSINQQSANIVNMFGKLIEKMGK
jgi:hypothetical protein